MTYGVMDIKDKKIVLSFGAVEELEGVWTSIWNFFKRLFCSTVSVVNEKVNSK